jgi:S1-C subfamily serine protease
MTKRNLFLFLIIIILSLLGGVMGGIFVRSYLLNSSVNVPLLGDINLGSSYQNGNFIISQPKKVVVEQDERADSVISGARKSIVDFYAKKGDSAVAPNQKQSVSAADFYFFKDRTGQGLVLTNDGWILTGSKIDNAENFIAADYEGNILPLESVKLIKGAYFVKVKANNLVAAPFSGKNDIQSGQMVVALHEQDSPLSYVENTNSLKEKISVKSSEKWYRFIKISNRALNVGDFVFNFNGLVAGLYDQDGLIVPIYFYTQALPALLNNKEFSRIYLGVNYIDLSTAVSEKKLSGALIAADSKGTAVIKNSPAALAGIKTGDIILMVEGVKIDAQNSLSEIIQGYQPETEIELTILREGSELSIKVKLGSIK